MNELSILELLEKGGWIMIVLGVLSLIAIYIFIERFIAIRSAEKNDPGEIVEEIDPDNIEVDDITRR